MEENEKSKKQNIHKHLKKSFNIIVATVGVAWFLDFSWNIILLINLIYKWTIQFN